MAVEEQGFHVISLTKLFIEQTYQREAKRRWITQQIQAGGFKPDVAGAITVTYVPDVGKYAIIDGQQRWELAIASGEQGITCFVLPPMVPADRAKHFVETNDGTQLMTFELMRAEYAAGMEPAFSIVELLHRKGWKIHTDTQQNGRDVAGATALRSVWLWGGELLLTWVIDIVNLAWPAGRFGPGHHNLRALAILKRAYGETLDDARLVTALQSASPERIKNDTADLRRGPTGRRRTQVYLDYYNKVSRTKRLPPEYLDPYFAKRKDDEDEPEASDVADE